MRYNFYLSEDHNVIVSYHVVFFEREFIQDEGSGRKIELEEKVSKKYRVQKSKPISEPIDVVPPPPYRSSRVSHPPERYLDILTENLEKTFLMGDKDIRNNPKTYEEAVLDVDFEK